MKTMRWYNRISVRVPTIMALCIILPVSFLWYSYYQNLVSHVLENAADSVANSLYISSIHMEYMMEEVDKFSKTLPKDEELVALLENYMMGDDQLREVARSKLSLLLNQYISENRLLSSIFIVMEDSTGMLTSLTDQKEISVLEGEGREIYQRYMEKYRNRTQWTSLSGYFSSEPTMLSYIRPLPLPTMAGQNCAVFCNVSLEYWTDLIDTVGFEESFIVLQDYDGTLKLSTRPDWYQEFSVEEQQEYERVFDNQDTYGSFRIGSGNRENLVIFYNSLAVGWKYMGIVPVSSLSSSVWKEMHYITGIALVGILAAFLGTFFMKKSVFHPISDLMDTMQRSEGGHLQLAKERSQKDEIGYLIDRYNHMVRELTHLIDEVYVQNILRKQAQIKSLQSQMDEHFLYNILNGIYCEACRENAETSADMLLVVSKYFRMSLASGRDQVFVSEVITLMQYYIIIQEMRYRDKLQCDFQVSGDFSHAVVLKYLFQPIVENAIVHGCENKEGVCHISVILERREELLYFEVRDDGQGMTEEFLEKLLRNMTATPGEGGGNYALRNISEQIRLTYGEAYTVSIESRADQGTVVSFHLPIVEEGEDNA